MKNKKSNDAIRRRDSVPGDDKVVFYNMPHAMIHKRIAEIDREKPLSSAAWAVLTFYGLNCNTDTGAIRVVSVKLLTEATGRSQRTIYNALAELEERAVMSFSDDTQIRGRHPYVALAKALGRVARERGKDPDRHAKTKFKRERQVIETAFGIETEQFDDAKIKELVKALKVQIES